MTTVYAQKFVVTLRAVYSNKIKVYFSSNLNCEQKFVSETGPSVNSPRRPPSWNDHNCYDRNCFPAVMAPYGVARTE